MRNTDEILWTAGFFNERFPAPISPLGWSLLGPLIEEIALREPLRYLGYPDAETIPLTRLWRGHPYANMLAFQIFYKCFPDFLLPEDACRYFPDGDASIRRRAPYPCSILSPRFLLSMLRGFLSDPRNFSPLHNYRQWARYTRVHDGRVAALHARFDALARAEPREIFAALREAERAHRDLLRIHRWSLMHADLTFGALRRLAGSREVALRAVADAPNKTLEVDAALRELVRQLETAPTTTPSLPSQTVEPTQVGFAQWLQRLPVARFLAAHGHRSFSLDIAAPTFADEPMQIARLLQSGEWRAACDMTGGVSRHSSPDTCYPLAVGGLLSAVKRSLFNAVLPLARAYVALREDQRYYWQKSLAVSRRLYLLLADRLAAAGVVAARDDVFYATHQELVEYFEARLAKDALARSIAARQAEWRGYMRAFEQSPAASYPAFLRGDTPIVRRDVVDTAQWRGRAVSPGVARGVARVVRSPGDLARVQHGDILIAPSTDPGWTPVFAKIAGLVLERGGVLSHGAVVAREYRLPAVVGIADAVEAIHDGEMIEVDGHAGVVTRI